MASVRKLRPKDPNSPWVVEYTGPDGKRRRETPKSGLKKDALEIRRRVEREIEEGSHTAASASKTVADCADAFLKKYEQRVKAGEVGRYGYNTRCKIVDNYILPRFGSRPIAELSFAEVEAFHTEIAPKLAPSTAKGHLLVLRHIEDFARKRGWTKKSTVAAVAKETTGRKGKIKTFTTEEVKTLLFLVSERVPQQRHRAHAFTRIAVNLAAFCGLRFGEIIALTAENVDTRNRVLHIRHNLTLLDELKGPKTKAGIRDVPMPQQVADMIDDWRQRFLIADERNLLFRDVRGGQYNRGGFHQNMWHPLLKRAGLFEEGEKDHYHFHALRHFAASAMIEMGIPLTDVASILGHEKFDMTLQVYAHPIVRGHRRHDAIDRMSVWLRGERDENATFEDKSLISIAAE